MKTAPGALADVCPASRSRAAAIDDTGSSKVPTASGSPSVATYTVIAGSRSLPIASATGTHAAAATTAATVRAPITLLRMHSSQKHHT
jgi:hypothetical protein